MNTHSIAMMVTAAVLSLAVSGASSEETATEPGSTDPLAPFERLVGGRWSIEGSCQEFEWGLGRRSVKARSYFVIDGEPMLVSEGMWYWNPAEEQIRGVFTAIEMPVVYFDYATRFEGDVMMNELRSYDAAGGKTVYEETWEFTDDDHFLWTLFRKTADGLKEEMGGTYSRSE